MSEPWLLSKAQMRRIEPYCPLSHGNPRVVDRRIFSGIICVIRGGLMWRGAPEAYGSHETIYNRFIRWSRLAVFNRIFAEQAAKAGEADTILIDGTHLKAHRAAASPLEEQGMGSSPMSWAHQRRPEFQAASGPRRSGLAARPAAGRRVDERLERRCPHDRRPATSKAPDRRQRLWCRLVSACYRRTWSRRLHLVEV